MILSLVAVLLQTAQAPAGSPADGRPVRVWLDSQSPLTRGIPVRVYVQAALDGNLVVLHRRTDGRIAVLFPANPTDAPRVQPGTYEIRGPGDAAAFVVSEPDGTGMILAALSRDPLYFDEFTRAASWNPDALAPSWGEADAEGALSDIVQRMLGAGSFNYDVVTYTVAPPVYAQFQQDSTLPYAPYPSCVDCTFIGFQEVIVEPSLFPCDFSFTPCFGFRRFRDHVPGNGSPAPNAQSTQTLALNLRPSGTTAHVLERRRPVASTPNDARAPRLREPIMPRPRVPEVGGGGTVAPQRALPLVPGTVARGPEPQRRVPSSNGVAAVASTAPSVAPLPGAPRRHVRYTRLSPVGDEAPAAIAVQGAVPVNRASRRAAGGGLSVATRAPQSATVPGAVAMSRGAVGMAQPAPIARAAPAATAVPPGPVPTRMRASAIAGGGGGATPGPSRGVALPGSVGRSGAVSGVRVGPARGGSRH